MKSVIEKFVWHKMMNKTGEKVENPLWWHLKGSSQNKMMMNIRECGDRERGIWTPCQLSVFKMKMEILGAFWLVEDIKNISR